MRVLGGFLLSLPLIAAIAAMVHMAGWKVTAGVWLFALVATGTVVLGAWMLTGGQW